MSLRIGILTQNYVPEPDPKMHILAAGLVRRGHSVTTLTGFPNYPTGRIYPGYKQRMWQVEQIDGVRVVRMPLFPDRSRSVLKRSLNYLTFPAYAALVGPWKCPQIDVLLVYHPPITLGVPAIVISRTKRAPFILEIQDLWPETLLATKMLSGGVITGCLSRLADATYRKATAITVISDGFRRNLISKGVPAEKLHVIHNWAYEGTFEPVPRDAAIGSEAGLDGKFNILYAGNMGPAQGLSNVLGAAALLSDLPDVQLVLMGSGIDKAALVAEAATRGLTNVSFIERQPMDRMPQYYAWADAVMIHLTDDPLFAITVPGKTQSCLASGRPVLACVAGDAADLIESAQAGLAVPPCDPISLAGAIRRLRQMERCDRLRMGQAGRRFYDERLAPDIAIARYESLFYSVLPNHRNHNTN